MPRRAVFAFGIVVVAGVILAAALAVTRESRLVYTLGAGPAAPVAVLRGGQEACQKPARRSEVGCGAGIPTSA
jgi:hypothetical protein